MLIENHHIMLYQFEKGWKATQPFRDLNEIFGEGTISKSQVERWFKSGDTNLADEIGRRRPSNFDDQALLAVEEDESLTTRMLTEDSMWNIRPPFVDSKSSKKYGNWLYGSPTNSPTTKPNVSEFSPICSRETSKHRS